MRIWLAGSRSFGAAVFDELRPFVEIVGITAPQDDALRRRAEHDMVPVTDHDRLVDIDLIVSAHNHTHISQETRDATTFGAIGYHPSLLPRHRGRSAVEWTIALGDPIAGGTVYKMDDGWDTGPIISQDWCHVVPGWNASDLWREKLFGMGVRLLKRAVLQIAEAQVVTCKPQDERVATAEEPWTTWAANAFGSCNVS